MNIYSKLDGKPILRMDQYNEMGGTDVAEGSNMKETGSGVRGHMVLEAEPTIQGYSQSFECISSLDPSASHINRFVRWKCASTLMSA